MASAPSDPITIARMPGTEHHEAPVVPFFSSASDGDCAFVGVFDAMQRPKMFYFLARLARPMSDFHQVYNMCTVLGTTAPKIKSYRIYADVRGSCELVDPNSSG